MRKPGSTFFALARRIGLLAAMTIAPALARAQQPTATAPPPRLEVWGGVGVSFGGLSGVLTSTYSPPLLLDGAFTSSATQTIAFETGAALGLQGGVNIFFAPRAGIQILGDGESGDVSGVSSPYSYTLRYTSVQPPNNQEVPVVVQNTTPWSAPTGSITDFRTSINGVVRLGASGRTSATISGGLTIHRLAGALEPLAYTSFHLGGHSVLFTDDYQLAVAMGPTMAVGVNVGGDVNIAVTRHVALMVGYRYVGGPDADVSARPSSVLNSEQITFEQPLTDIAQRLALPPVAVSLSRSRLVAGVKFMR